MITESLVKDVEKSIDVKMPKEEWIALIEAENDPDRKYVMIEEFINWHVDDEVVTKAYSLTTRAIYAAEILRMKTQH